MKMRRIAALWLLATCAADYVADISELRSRLAQLRSGDSVNISLPAGAHLRLGGEQLVVSAGTSVRIATTEESFATSIDGEARSRLFAVHGQLELVGLHLTAGVAERGGAVRAYAGSRVLLRGVSITDCMALSDSEGHAMGGAIDATSTELELTNCEVRASAVISAGSGNAMGGGVNAKDSRLLLDRTTVSNCSASAAGNGHASGGGICMTEGNATISRSVLESCWVKTGACRDTPGVLAPLNLASDCAFALQENGDWVGSSGDPWEFCAASVGATSDFLRWTSAFVEPPFEPEGFTRDDLIADLCPASCAAYYVQASCMRTSGEGSAQGGALFKQGGADLMLNGTNVTNSSARSSGFVSDKFTFGLVSAGGGIGSVGGGSLMLLASAITWCSAVSEGGGRTMGGGVHKTGTSTLLIDSSVVSDCFARGQIEVNGGGIFSENGESISSLDVRIVDSIITRCSATVLHGPGGYIAGPKGVLLIAGANGGGVSLTLSDMALDRSIISDCWVNASKLCVNPRTRNTVMEAKGGALYTADGRVTIRNSTFARCVAYMHVHERTIDAGGMARAQGGAIYAYSRFGDSFDGACRVFDDVTLCSGRASNVTLVRTDVTECRAVALGGGRASAEGGGLVTNTEGSTSFVAVTRLVESSVSGCTATNEGAGPSKYKPGLSVDGNGDARGGGLVGLFSAVTLAMSNVSNCVAVSKDGKGLGGGMYVLQQDALSTEMSGMRGINWSSTDSKLAMNASNITGNSASTVGGGMALQGGMAEMGSLSRVGDNTASEGANLISKGAVVYSFYPLPPGHWLAGSECRVNRKPCPTACANAWGDQECNSRVNMCLEVEHECSLLPDTNSAPPTVRGQTCNEATFFQQCDWMNEPGLLGHRVYTTLSPFLAIDDDFPNACPPGILGSAEAQYQTSGLCERKCPAGSYCPTKATVDAILCPNGSYCPEGSPAHHACPDGTVGNRTGLKLLEECAPCTPGHYCSSGEALPCELGFYAVGPPQSRHKSSACRTCPGGTYGHTKGLSEASQCAACPDGHFCSNGARTECGKGSYTNATANRTSLEACLACPFNTTTLSSGHASVEACVCQPAFFDDLGRGATEATDPATGARRCLSCPLGFACNFTSSTSLTSHVSYGFWRPSTAALQSKRCPYPNTCVGGPSAASFALDEKATCRDGFKGAFCTLCAERRKYYLDKSRQACRECRFALGLIGGAIGSVALAAALVLFAASRFAPARSPRSINIAGGCLGRQWRSVCDTLIAGTGVLTTKCKHAWGHPAVHGVRRAISGVAGKLRPLLGFALVVAQFKDVYQIRYPPEYQTLASIVLQPLQFDWLNFLPAVKLSCVGIDTLFEELLFFSLLPLGIVLLVFAYARLRHRTLVPALPLVLRLTFVFYPAVSSKGFQTLAPCECFDLLGEDDPTLCLLRASYSVQCVGTGRDKYAPPHLFGLGIIVVLLYGLCVPLFYALLLFCCRTAIRDEQEAPLPKALAFLHEGLHPWALYWPLIEALRALILTGVLALVDPGTLFQLLIGLLGAFGYTVLQVWCAPYRAPTANFFAMVINAAIVLNFVSMIGVRVTASTDVVELDVNELYLSAALYVAFLAVVSTALLPLVNICGKAKAELPDEPSLPSGGDAAAGGYACGSTTPLPTRLRRLLKLAHLELNRPLVSSTQGAVPPEGQLLSVTPVSSTPSSSFRGSLELSVTPLSSTPSSSFRGSSDQEELKERSPDAHRAGRILELAGAF